MRTIFLFSFALFLCSCEEITPKTYRYSGKTMGTTFNIVTITDDHEKTVGLEAAIEKSLKKVNKHLSNWDPDSEISRINQTKHTKPIKISQILKNVMIAANDVHNRSLGLFDITLGKLINLWGFGPEKKNSKTKLPSDEDIQNVLSQIGQSNKLLLDLQTNTLQKIDPNIRVNLSAIAKGFGVDEIGKTLTTAGMENYMVEIGGDLITRGYNPKGKQWQIGIEHPNSAGKQIELIVKISNVAMATSGDYRNYFEKDGIRYSHIMNVKTGRPITHKTASVTVIADTAMMADAWATALLALGKKEGMKIATQNNIAAFFIFKSETKGFATIMSPRFKKLHTQK